jgi:hypothetical protein
MKQDLVFECDILNDLRDLNVKSKVRDDLIIRLCAKMLNFDDITSAKRNNNAQTKKCTYDVTLRRVRGNIVAVEKQKGIIYSKCVCCVTQHAQRMRHILLSSVACLSGCTKFFHIIS